MLNIYSYTYIYLTFITINEVCYGDRNNSFSEELLRWDGKVGLTDNDLPYTNLSELADIEKSTKFKLKVIILTMNRPESLERLLISINSTYFEYPQDSIDLEIHIDKSSGWLYRDVIKLAEGFKLSAGRGNVTVVKFPKNHGLRVAWFDSWRPRTIDDHAVIIEDDLELSPQWYSWLKRAWLSYGHRSDLAGIALSRQYMMVKKPEYDVEIPNNGEPFLYRLVGTWGFSPHPARWSQMLDWFYSIDHDNFDPYVPGLITSDWLHIHNRQGRRHMTWEQWHIYYGNLHGLFTLYQNLPTRQVLLNNWREAGVHSRTSPNKPDYPLVKTKCPIQLQSFPSKLRKYDWDASEIK